jgi:hypothetical protein
MNHFTFIYITLGIFCIEGNLYPSFIMNTSFRNISDPSLYTDGGVLYLNSSSYENFTIDRCIFALCRGFCGGAIYLGSFSPWIKINRCLFDGNIANNGSDIYVSRTSCFSDVVINNSCTTMFRTSITCFSVYINGIPPCSIRIVFFFIFYYSPFFFIFFFFFC